jgi:hypothetical protein
MCKGKGKFHPITGHEGPDREQMYSSTLPSSSALAPPDRFTPGKDPIPIVLEAGWVPGPVWTGAGSLAAIGIRSPDRPARRTSLYRLSYPGPLVYLCVSYHSQDTVNHLSFTVETLFFGRLQLSSSPFLLGSR